MESKTKTPKWLRKLERESWQAELIISGLAIYGTLQLPALFTGIMEWAVTYFSPDNYFILYLFYQYLLMAAYVLILAFIIHFILRAFWIGLIGLNSVYPEGIKRDGGMYSPAFMDLLIESLPNNQKLIRQLDSISSTIFASGAYGAVAFLAFNIDILIIIFLRWCLSQIAPPHIVQIIVNLFIGAVLLLLFVNILLNLKYFKNKPWVPTLHFKLYKFTSQLIFNIFYWPALYIGNVFQTNLNLKKYFGWSFVLTILFMVFFIYAMRNSRILKLANEDRFVNYYNRTDANFPENYTTFYLQNNARILSTIIESDQIENNQLKVFVPIFENEAELQSKVCGTWSEPKEGSKEEKRAAERIFYLNCYQQYHKFYINDQEVNVDVLKYRHPNKNEFGIMTYIPTTLCRAGKNILSVEKLKDKNGLVYRSMQIPFWFSK